MISNLILFKRHLGFLKIVEWWCDMGEEEMKGKWRRKYSEKNKKGEEETKKETKVKRKRRKEA